MRRVCVLYEDQRGPTKGFGLHELVKACVRDALDNVSRRDVDGALADCRPMKGTPKLLNACRQDIDLIANDGRSVIAVFDNDQIRRDLKLSQKAMESILKAVRQCDGSIDPARLDSALRKDLLERDALLNGLTADPKRPIRDCVQDKMPSLRGLVDLLCREIAPRTKTRARPAPKGKRSRAKAR